MVHAIFHQHIVHLEESIHHMPCMRSLPDHFLVYYPENYPQNQNMPVHGMNIQPDPGRYENVMIPYNYRKIYDLYIGLLGLDHWDLMEMEVLHTDNFQRIQRNNCQL